MQQNTLGDVAYEITNYLGNVNVVISDRKIWTGTPTSAFKACVVSRTDYFPFGMEISSRTSNSDTYRFGYNGMESDDETKGSGNSYTTEFRQYDPRIGRWLSLDPLMAQFPWQSPYCAFDNNPVFFTDPTGLATEDWVKKEGSNKWEWDPDVKSPGAAKTKYGPNTEHAAVGTILDGVTIEGSGIVGTVQLLEGRAKYFMDDVVVSAESSSKADDSFSFGFDLSSTMNASSGYNISNIDDLRANWQNMDQFVTIMHYATISALTIPALPALVEFSIFASPYVVNSSITVGRLTVNGFKLYHKAIGMNGGYANAGLNWINQSYVQGGKPSNYLSFEGKSLTGLIMAGSMGYSSMILKQAAVGAADPWASINYSNGILSLQGFASGNQTFHKTLILSSIGTLGPLYGGVPLFNNSTINLGIQQVLFTPIQKVTNDVKE